MSNKEQTCHFTGEDLGDRRELLGYWSIADEERYRRMGRNLLDMVTDEQLDEYREQVARRREMKEWFDRKV